MLTLSIEQLILAAIAAGSLIGIILTWFSHFANEAAAREANMQARLDEQAALKKQRAITFLAKHRKEIAL
jgi:hypothetical protein